MIVVQKSSDARYELKVESIDPTKTKGSRSTAYATRFHQKNLEKLDLFDETSEHFGIFRNHILVGGYRVTRLGNKKSEVETLFSNTHFPINSVELGRFWIDEHLQNEGLATNIFDRLFLTPGTLRSLNVFLKTGSELGRAVEKYGFKTTSQSIWHPVLLYQSTLYFRKADLL